METSRRHWGLWLVVMLAKALERIGAQRWSERLGAWAVQRIIARAVRRWAASSHEP